MNIINGTGSGTFEEGTEITITAKPNTLEKRFEKWEVKNKNVTLNDEMSTTTTFIMPAEDVEITAIYHIHSYDKYQSDETNHWKECTCGEKQNRQVHIIDAGTLSQEATYTTTGLKVYQCSDCGYVMKTEIIPMLQKDQNKPINPDKPIIPEQPIKPETPKEPLETDSNKKVETGDISLSIFYAMSMCITLGIIMKIKKIKE